MMHKPVRAKIFISLIEFCCLIPVFGMSQSIGKTEVILQDNRINSLIAKHKAFNESKGTIKGFRIQIFFDSGNNSKAKAMATMNEFNSKHRKVEAYLSFQEPNFKVRVGDFRTRMDAQRFLQKIIEDYPTAFIVKDDEINYPSLEDDPDEN